MAKIKYAVPEKEGIIEYYINQNHTKQETAEFYHTSLTTLSRWLKQYDILKPMEQRGVQISKYSSKKIDIPSKEEIYHYYIEELNSKEDCAKHFQVSVSTIGRWLILYNIHRDKENYAKIAKKYSKPKSEETKEKTKQTCMHKYGVDNPFKNQQIKLKIKETIVNKYGVDNIAHSALIQEKKKQTSLKKYGVPSHTQKNIKHLDLWLDDEKFIKWVKEKDSCPSTHYLSNFFNVDITVIDKKLHRLGLEECFNYKYCHSSYEDEIINFLRQDLHIDNIIQNDRKILDGCEIDIYLPDYKVGIEFNGEYWHSDLWEKYQDHGGRSTTHQNKSLLAQEKGVFLFHIFEHEWNPEFTRRNNKFSNSVETIKNRLRNILSKTNYKIGARSCEVREINHQDKKDFLDENHIQGNDITSKISLGLFYKNELVACMCFGTSKYKKYTWELTRFCSKKNLVIQGGASKLLSYFVKHYTKGLKVSPML